MVAVKIGKAGQAAVEIQINRAGRTVALLGDDDAGGIADIGDAFLPAGDAVLEPVAGFVHIVDRLAFFQVIFLAVDEHDHIGVLLDGAGFAKVGEHRDVRRALLHGARELRRRNDRHVQLARQLLQRTCNLANFTGSRVGASTAVQQLQVVDNHKVELIGAKPEAIDKAEDREKFRIAMANIGLETPKGKAFWKIAWQAFFPLLTPIFILGSIFSGFATATEAAVIAVAYGFILALVYRELNFRTYREIMVSSAVTSATILIIISAANAFTYVLTANRIPVMISNFFLEYATSPWMFLIIVSIILLILGTLTEVTSLIVLLSPIFMPIATQYGIDPVHFGMVLIMNFALANITPPVGLSLIAGCSITDRKMGIEETLPYILHVLAIVGVMVAIIIFFPPLSTFLPGLFK